jgi:hypothetical protein
LIQKYRISGLTQKDFCHENGLNYHTLSAWIYFEKQNLKPKEKEKKKEILNFIPLEKEDISLLKEKPIEIKNKQVNENKIRFEIKFKIKIPKFISFQGGTVLSKELP